MTEIITATLRTDDRHQRGRVTVEYPDGPPTGWPHSAHLCRYAQEYFEYVVGVPAWVEYRRRPARGRPLGVSAG